MTNLLAKWRHEAKTRLPELLEEVANSIKTVHPDSTVILFGSYARGEQHEDSDLDICVLVPELTGRRLDMNVEIRGLIRRLCYDNGLPFDVKLYTYAEFEQETKYKSTIQHTIREEGVVLYEHQRENHGMA